MMANKQFINFYAHVFLGFNSVKFNLLKRQRLIKIIKQTLSSSLAYLQLSLDRSRQQRNVRTINDFSYLSLLFLQRRNGTIKN